MRKIILAIMFVLCCSLVSASYCNERNWTGVTDSIAWCDDFEDGDVSDWTAEATLNDTHLLDGKYSIDMNISKTVSPQWSAINGTFNVSFRVRPTVTFAGYGRISFAGDGTTADPAYRGCMVEYDTKNAGNCGSNNEICVYDGGWQRTYIAATDVDNFTMVVFNDSGTVKADIFYNINCTGCDLTANLLYDDAECKDSLGITDMTYFSFVQTQNVSHIDDILVYNESITPGIFIDNCTSYTNQSLRFRFLNGTNYSSVQATINAHFSYYNDELGGITTKNYSFSTVDNETYICKYPENVTVFTDIHIDYTTDGTSIFTYKANRTMLGNTTQTIDLHISDSTTLTTFTVKDTTDTELEGAYIKILKWDVGNNEFKLVSQLETDFNGEALGHVNQYDTWYKFMITYNGKLVLDTEPTKVTSDTVNFVVNLEADFYSQGLTGSGMYATLTFDNTSKFFTFTWDDLGTNIDKACLVIEKHTINGITNVNSSCSSTPSPSGSIVLGIGDDVGTNTYIAKAYVNNANTIVRTLEKSFADTWRKFGTEGVWVTFLFVLTLTMIGVWNIAVAILLAIVGIITANVLGFMYMQVAWVLAIAVIGIIVIIRINRGT